MKPDIKFQRAAKLSLTRPLETYGRDAPEWLRPAADVILSLGDAPVR